MTESDPSEDEYASPRVSRRSWDRAPTVAKNGTWVSDLAHFEPSGYLNQQPTVVARIRILR